MKLLTGQALGRIIEVIAYAMILTGCGGVQITSNSNGAASIGVSNSSRASALISLNSSSYTAVPAAALIVTIDRTGSSAGSASVSYSTVDGSASAGADYLMTSGSVAWQDGDSAPKTVTVPVTARAAGKYFSFALSDVEGQATFGSPASATVEVNGSADLTSGSVTLSWTAPTENTNGTALTNLAGFDIHYGNSAGAMTRKISINSVGNLSYVIDDLNAGTWYFEVYAINAFGVQSGPSSTVSTTI
jgi:hypothetical protein